MSTKVVPLNQGVRIVSGQLVPYVDIDWQAYGLDELTALLRVVMPIEIEHNFKHHKEYKDKAGANVEVHQSLNKITVTSVNHELLYVQDAVHVFDELNKD